MSRSPGMGIGGGTTSTQSQTCQAPPSQKETSGSAFADTINLLLILNWTLTHQLRLNKKSDFID